MGNLGFVRGSVLALLVGAAGATHALDVRPGLWEQTVTTDMGNLAVPSVPPEVLAKLPPEQRKQMGAMMARKPQTQTNQSCVTAEQLAQHDKDPFAEVPENGLKCTRDIIKKTARQLQARLVCTGNTPMTAEANYEAVNDRTISGSTVVTQQQGGKPVTVKMTFQGRWVSADCGKVAPAR